MKVAKGINVEDIGETWRQTEILEEAGEHVPGITLDKISYMPLELRSGNIRRGMKRRSRYQRWIP